MCVGLNVLIRIHLPLYTLWGDMDKHITWGVYIKKVPTLHTSIYLYKHSSVWIHTLLGMCYGWCGILSTQYITKYTAYIVGNWRGFHTLALYRQLKALFTYTHYMHTHAVYVLVCILTVLRSITSLWGNDYVCELEWQRKWKFVV